MNKKTIKRLFAYFVEDKKNVIIIIFFSSIFFAFFYDYIFIQGNKNVNSGQYISYTLEQCESNGMLINGTKAESLSSDPMLFLDVEDTYVDNIRINFENEVVDDFLLQVFYVKKDNKDFTEELSVLKYVSNSSIEVKINIKDDVEKLRIDLSNEIGRTFNISSIEINPSENEFGIYNVPMVIRILCIEAVLIGLIILVKCLYDIEQKKLVGMKCSNKTIIIGLILLYIICANGILDCTDTSLKESFWESDLIKTHYFSSNDVKGFSPDYEITGIDPFVVYEVENDRYCRGIINFDEMSEKDISYEVYYSPTFPFVGELKTICTQKKGTNYATFEMEKDYFVQFIRVDYVASDGISIGEEFDLESVYVVKDNFTSNLHAILTVNTIFRLLCLTIIFCVVFILCIKKYKAVEKLVISDRLKTAIDLTIIVVLPIILFWNYLTGQVNYVFSDVASDSIGQAYPVLLHISDRIDSGILSETFSFAIGLGNREDAIVPNIYNWPAFFGRENVAHLMSISIFLKVVLSGLFTYGFVGLWGIKDEKRILVTLGYEYNTMLIVRSSWSAYPNVALMVMIWLYSFELIYRYNRKLTIILFAFITEVFFGQFDLYYCVLYGGLFFIYIIYRFISDKGEIKNLIQYLLCYCIFAFWGVADSLANSLLDALSSKRFITGKEMLMGNMEEYLKIDWNTLFEAFIRSIGHSISGINSEFLGRGNFLEGPAFYFGIMMLMIIPVVFYNLPEFKKKLYSIGYICIILFISVPFFRMIVSGFAAPYFKITSFWITIFLIIATLEAFRNIKENGVKRYSLLIFNVTSSIGLFLIIAMQFTGSIAHIEQWWCSLIYFLVYAFGVNFIVLYKRKVFVIILWFVLITEGVVVSYSSVNDRDAWSDDELAEVFYDDAFDAIQSINKEEQEWFRIEKVPLAVSLCDSLAQQYFSTQSYVGGTEIGEGVQNYYRQLSLPNGGGHYMRGTAGNFYANALLGVKYIYLGYKDNVRYGSKYISSYGDINVYRNEYALPLGYCYDTCISEEEFYKMSYVERNKCLLEACVLGDGYLENKQIEQLENVYRGRPIISKFSKGVNSINVSAYKGKVIVLKINWLQGCDTDSYGTICWTNLEGGIGYEEFSYRGVIELINSNMDVLAFDAKTTKMVESVCLYAYDPDEYYFDSINSIKKRQETGLIISNFMENEIIGKIVAKEDGVFATSIPYDKNWEIYIDGNKVDVILVNTGFIGTEITSGEHQIRIHYKHNTWLYDNKFKCIGLSIIVLWWCKMFINRLLKSPLT